MNAMRLTLVLSFVGVALIECIFASLMLSMWKRRKELLVRARSVEICLLQGCLVSTYFPCIVTQEILRAHDIDAFPCSLNLWLTIIVAPMYLSAMELRAVRVVIISNPSYRVKYIKFTSLNVSDAAQRMRSLYHAYLRCTDILPAVHHQRCKIHMLCTVHIRRWQHSCLLECLCSALRSGPTYSLHGPKRPLSTISASLCSLGACC
jgi:hypothetical protein